MKTASIPAVRVSPELRNSAESLLEEGETLSNFVEKSILAQINFRKTQQEFIARGLAGKAEAERTGDYVSVDQLMQELDESLGTIEAR